MEKDYRKEQQLIMELDEKIEDIKHGKYREKYLSILKTTGDLNVYLPKEDFKLLIDNFDELTKIVEDQQKLIKVNRNIFGIVKLYLKSFFN